MKKFWLFDKKQKKNFPYAKTDKKFLPTQHLKLNFYTNQQKQLLAQIAKIKKKNRILSIRFFALLQKKNKTILEKSTQNLKKQILNNKIQIQKIRSIYNFLFSSLQTISLKKSARLWKKKIILDRMQKQKLNCFWKACKKQFSSLRRIRFLKKELPFLLLKLNKKSAQSISKSNCNILKKNAVLKKVLHLNFLIGQMSGNAFLIRNYLLFTRFNFISKLNSKRKNKQKILRRFSFKSLQVHSFLKKNLGKNKKKSLQKKQLAAKLYYDIALWTVLRKKKKKKVKNLKSKFTRRKLKKFQKNFLKKIKCKSYNQYTNFLAKNKFLRKTKQKQILQHIKKIKWSLKTHRIARYYRYRLPYRKMYFHFLQLQTNFKFKYLIQDFVQKYFSVQVETKISHVLNAQKNTNFFRLIFPVRKKKQNFLIKKRRFDIWNQKKIFLASRLKLVTRVKKKKEIKANALLAKTASTKKNAMKILTKKKLFLLLEKKRLKWRMNNYFSRITQGKEFRSLFKYLMPTLIDFSHTLDPQLLADVLAKVVKKSKKQTWMLNTIKNILQAMQLPKNVGYKIVLSGRINSKKKSRLIYITHKQITLQVFNKNMNFAYSQANARIGAFGVKIWVYSKRA